MRKNLLILCVLGLTLLFHGTAFAALPESLKQALLKNCTKVHEELKNEKKGITSSNDQTSALKQVIRKSQGVIVRAVPDEALRGKFARLFIHLANQGDQPMPSSPRDGETEDQRREREAEFEALRAEVTTLILVAFPIQSSSSSPSSCVSASTSSSQVESLAKDTQAACSQLGSPDKARDDLPKDLREAILKQLDEVKKNHSDLSGDERLKKIAELTRNSLRGVSQQEVRDYVPILLQIVDHANSPFGEKAKEGQEEKRLAVTDFILREGKAIKSKTESQKVKEVIPKAPVISTSELFTELLISEEYKGWVPKTAEVETLRGANGYEFLDRQVPTGDSSANRTMGALSDPLLGQTPLYLVNEQPVVLNNTAESQAFFHGLPHEMREKENDGRWIGHRYVFYRDALIDTSRYIDSDSRKPLSVFLMKKVSPETGAQFAITKKQQEKFEKRIDDQKESHDLLHEALSLKQTQGQSPEQKRKRERARAQLKQLAQRGIPLAQYHYALMLKTGEAGPANLSEAQKFAKKAADQGLPEIPFVPSASVASASSSSSGVNAAVPAPLASGSVMERFRAQFVQIPTGRLPDGTQIAAVQADKYPVTRELWNEIMGGMPTHVPEDQRTTWSGSPRVPVTHVNWENENGSPAEVQEFLRRLNEREQATRCTYDLPTDKQLWYLIRADITGTNTDRFSAGVTVANVNQYVTHSDNSNNQIQPVGQKTANRFGIELGNVWKMSKDLYDSAHRDWGRSVRGGSWDGVVGNAESGGRGSAGAGYRSGSMGFALLRTCH